MARNLISDEEWAFFEGFIRGLRHPKRREPADHRLVLNAIFLIARTGAPWRELPGEFENGPRFTASSAAGRTQAVGKHPGRADHAGIAPDKLQMVDIEPVSATGLSEPATVIRAPHHAANAKEGLLT